MYAGIKMYTGEIVHRGLRYELVPVSMLISAAVSFYLLLKGVELLILCPTRHTGGLLFQRAMSVRDGKARSRAILVFFGLDPAPPSFRHAHLRVRRPSGLDPLALYLPFTVERSAEVRRSNAEVRRSNPSRSMLEQTCGG